MRSHIMKARNVSPITEAEKSIRQATDYFNKKQYEIAYELYQKASDLIDNSFSSDELSPDLKRSKLYCKLSQLETQFRSETISFGKLKNDFEQLQEEMNASIPAEVVVAHLEDPAKKLIHDLKTSSKDLQKEIRNLDDNPYIQAQYDLAYVRRSAETIREYLDDIQANKVSEDNEDDENNEDNQPNELLQTRIEMLRLELKEEVLISKLQTLADEDIGFAKKIYEDVSIKADKKQELHSILRSIYESLGDLYSDQAKTKNTNEEKIDPLQKAADYYRLAILEIDMNSEESQYASQSLELYLSLLRSYDDLVICDPNNDIEYLDKMASIIHAGHIEENKEKRNDKTEPYLEKIIRYSDKENRTGAYEELLSHYETFANAYSNYVADVKILSVGEQIKRLKAASQYYEYHIAINDSFSKKDKKRGYEEFHPTCLKKLEMLYLLIGSDSDHREEYEKEANDFIQNYKIKQRIQQIVDEEDRLTKEAQLLSFGFTSETVKTPLRKTKSAPAELSNKKSDKNNIEDTEEKRKKRKLHSTKSLIDFKKHKHSNDTTNAPRTQSANPSLQKYQEDRKLVLQKDREHKRQKESLEKMQQEMNEAAELLMKFIDPLEPSTQKNTDSSEMEMDFGLSTLSLETSTNPSETNRKEKRILTIPNFQEDESEEESLEKKLSSPKENPAANSNIKMKDISLAILPTLFSPSGFIHKPALKKQNERSDASEKPNTAVVNMESNPAEKIHTVHIDSMDFSETKITQPSLKDLEKNFIGTFEKIIHSLDRYGKFNDRRASEILREIGRIHCKNGTEGYLNLDGKHTLIFLAQSLHEKAIALFQLNMKAKADLASLQKKYKNILIDENSPEQSQARITGYQADIKNIERKEETEKLKNYLMDALRKYVRRMAARYPDCIQEILIHVLEKLNDTTPFIQQIQVNTNHGQILSAYLTDGMQHLKQQNETHTVGLTRSSKG